MTSFEASRWIRERPAFLQGTRPRLTQGPGGIFFRPTTAQLRRLLAHPSVPKGVKGHVYEWLRYRRAASRRRRHPHAA